MSGFNKRALHLGAVFLEDVEGLIRSLPPSRAHIVRRLLWIAQYKGSYQPPTCACGNPRARGSERCRPCHLVMRKAQAPAHTKCIDCGKTTSSASSLRCRTCENIRRGARHCACGKKLPAKNKSGQCGGCYYALKNSTKGPVAQQQEPQI